MTYESNVDSIIEELITRLKEIERLENRVYYGFPEVTREFPTLWVHFNRDEVEVDLDVATVSSPLVQHTLFFTLVYTDRWNASEEPSRNEDLKIERVGEVIDKLREYMTNYPKWELLTYPKIEFDMTRREMKPSYILLRGVIEVRIRKKW